MAYIKGICRILKCKRGSLIVETTIILPIFLIGILTLAYLMKYIYMADEIETKLVIESKNAAIEANLVGTTVAGGFLERDAGTLATIDYKNIHANSHNGGNDVIIIDATYLTFTRLPIQFIKPVALNESISFRAWTGRKDHNHPMSWDDMRKDGNSDIKYIFPRAGERYHVKDCTYITNSPVEKILTASIKSTYGPCKICDAKTAIMYSLVYCYIKSGEVYHIASCPLVDKYVIEIDKKEAEEKGYTPCKKCG